MKNRKAIFILLSLLLISCVTQKPILQNIPEVDYNSPIYYSKDNFSLVLNGELLYKLITFGTTNVNSNQGSKINNAKSQSGALIDFLNYPFGNFDYSFALEPSLSMDSKYLAMANKEFSLFNLRLNTNVDIDILDLSNSEKNCKFTITLPHMEYKDEKYQIPWSSHDEAFFGIQNDSLYKIYINPQAKSLLLTISELYNFSVAKSEKSAIIYASDTLWYFDLKNDVKNLIYNVGKTLGINRQYVRSFNWNEDESKVTFSIGWDMFIYNLHDNTLSEIDAGAKIFSIEWLNDNQLLLVTGDYPSDMSTMQNNKMFSMATYSINEDKFSTIHERINHEPLSIKPRLSPSQKLILFSEKKLNGPYQVKIMTLDGQYENVLAEGYLPFWGK